MQEFLINLSTDYAIWTYPAIVILAALEGPFLSMLLGVLMKLDYFPLWPVYFALVIGDLVGDVFWYIIGYKYGYKFVDKYGKYVNVTPETVERALKIFHNHEGKILFLSKVSNGLTLALAVLVIAGIAKVPFRKYFAINVLGQFIWTALLLAIGYFFGNLYIEVDSWLGRVSVVALFLVALAAFLGYKKYLGKKLEKL